MKKLVTFFWATLLVVAFIGSGCDDLLDQLEDAQDSLEDVDNNLEDTAGIISLSISNDTLIKIPKSMRDSSVKDYNLKLAVDYVDLANSLAKSYVSNLMFDENEFDFGWKKNKNSDGSLTYSFDYGNVGTWVTVVNTNNLKSWRWEIKSDTIDRYTLYYAEETNTGGLFYWNEEGNKLAWKMDWTKGTSLSSVNIENFSSDRSLDEKMMFTSNPDQSGTFKVVSGTGVPQWDFQWNSSGHGTYKYYEDGKEIASGKF